MPTHRTAFQPVAALLVIILCAAGMNWPLPVPAATHYVNLASDGSALPYLTWASAATSIQDAIDAALPGDEILVTNGVYQTGGQVVYGSMTNRVALTKRVTVRSVNGPEVTVILGYQVPDTTNGDSAVRCAYLTNDAMLIGFTLTGGATRSTGDAVREQSGGGLWAESTRATASNCVCTGNSAINGGGGYGCTLNNCSLTRNCAWGKGGAFDSGTLDGCTIANNASVNGGGVSGSSLNNCTLVGNSASSNGGGAQSSTLYGCTVATNAAQVNGGGVATCGLNRCQLLGNTVRDGSGGGRVGSGGGSADSTLRDCTIAGNSVWSGFGGGAFRGTLWNCALTANSSQSGGGAWSATLNNCVLSGNYGYLSGGGADSSTLNNCTVIGNSSDYGGGVYSCGLNNSIVYHNAGFLEGENHHFSQLKYCCTTPLPPGGLGNFTNPPLCVDEPGANFRLQSASPCINAGNNASVPIGADLDSHQRIVGGTVDVGAYEYQTPASTISYAWLMQYGLPVDGSADGADPDGDRASNYDEWRAGTDPTDPRSMLRLLKPLPVTAGVSVSWQSVTGRVYVLERSTNQPSLFQPKASNIVGRTGTTAFVDGDKFLPAPVLYRVRVQE